MSTAIRNRRQTSPRPGSPLFKATSSPSLLTCACPAAVRKLESAMDMLGN
jgi:hypothetical protein